MTMPSFVTKVDCKSAKGYQFRFEWPDLTERKYFSIKKYNGWEGAKAAAEKYRDDFLKSATELGLVDINALHARYDAPVLLALSPRNTSGIVGVHRSFLERKSRKTPDINWVVNYQDESGKNKQKKFPVAHHGEKEALLKAISYRRDYETRVAQSTVASSTREHIENHIKELNALLELIADLDDNSEIFFFLGTINNPLLSNTTKQDMLNVRIGQRRFRKLVLDYWNHKCVLTGARHFVTAAHIKPWSKSDNSERLDVHNGLALSPVYDKAFDAGLISFDDNGTIMVADRLKHDATLLGITGKEIISGLNFLVTV